MNAIAAITITVFLPFVSVGPNPQFLTGLYEIGGGVPVAAVDTAWGTHHALLGDFVDLRGTYDRARGERRHAAGYTEFINLMTDKTAFEIATGCCDDLIDQWADSYATWSLSWGKAFLAPLPEMNGVWTPYGGDPGSFKLAYRRIRAIFRGAGANAYWVFAPNGWSSPPYTLTDYYPGDEVVDVVGLSGFNWGTSCSGCTWQTPAEVFDPYVTRLRAQTPRPILISQTGSTSAGGSKSQWFEQFWQYIRAAGLAGAIEFNINKETDWAVCTPDYAEPAYRAGVARQPYVAPDRVPQALAW